MAFIPDGISMLIIIINVKWSVSLLVVLLYIICGTISRFFNEIESNIIKALLSIIAELKY